MRSPRKTKRWLIAPLGVIAVLGLCGAVYQSLAQSVDLAQWPAPGRLIDVNGHVMHLYCQGEGSPTLVIEQGNGGYYSHWEAMNAELSQLTGVCAYDRAGMGYSESLGRPVGTQETAELLHALLSETGIDDDLILVGWSAGGIHVRSYYAQFPERVVAMILVDSSHEQQQSRMPAAISGFDLRRPLAYLAPLGVIRLSGEVDKAVDREPGSLEHKQRSKAVYKQSHWLRAYFAEFDGFNADQSLNSTPPSLGNLPLRVISRGKPVPPGGDLEAREMVWQELQKELVLLSTKAERMVAEGSGHSVHLDQPEIILSAARELVDDARAGRDAGLVR